MLNHDLQSNPRRIAIEIIDRVFLKDSYSDRLLESILNRSRLSDKDRALTSELVYGTLRWLYWLDWNLKQVFHGKWSNIPRFIKRNLEVALYQIIYLDRVPNYAAVNEAVKFAKTERGEKWGAIVNGMLRTLIRNNRQLELSDKTRPNAVELSIRWSHPLWLINKMIQKIGFKRTEKLCMINNERPTLKIRVNPLKTDRKKLQKLLINNNIESTISDYLDEFLIIREPKRVLDLEIFHQGFFSVQDISAGLVTHLLNPKPGDRIIDLAAAPGGKATHIGEFTQDAASIFAVDIHLHRLLKLVENCNRLGLRSLFPILSDGTQFDGQAFDKVLIDAPCSATGIIQRKAEIRYRRELKDIQPLIKLQTVLLENGSRMVTPGGVLVYSTCSILDEENEDVINVFLDHHPDFYIDHAGKYLDLNVVTDKGTIRTWPDFHHLDGSFAIRLKKRS